MADWPYQFPSVTAFFKLIGDKTYAERFRGNALNLLYELKNLMTFRKLGQLIMFRRFTDGTTITAKSVFGYDFLTIDVSRSIFAAAGIGIEESCTITMVYLNEYVPPMRNPGEIKEGEQEGLHYIKTYYSFDKSKCPLCEDEVEWEFLFNYETEGQVDYYDSEPTNHCVVSQDGGCFGQVIEQGADENGRYILWKAFTEASNQNRSGLGYMNFRAVLKNRETQEVVCEFTDIIGVDCCIKDGLEPTDIYWDCGIWTPCETDPLEIYGASLGLGRVPSVISYLNWSDCAAKAGGCHFYAIPEAGGCPPYEWTLSGPGILIDDDPLGRGVILQGEEGDITKQCADLMLSVIDRCGTQDSIRISCCDFAYPLSISYTTLQMSCSEQQTLFPVGGCQPYQWNLSGGGSIESLESGLAVYTAPDTNPDCNDNATITLTDCCGNAASIQIAVNCYTADEDAWVQYFWVYFFDAACEAWCTNGTAKKYNLNKFYYKCDGAVRSAVGVGNACVAPEHDPYLGGSICAAGGVGAVCYTDPTCGPKPASGLGGWGCDGVHVYPAHGQTYDCRTPAQKAAGCCPLNPYTGLPF